MQLILFYGAPGTGKYTIASALAERTGIPILHNHIILNALSEIFGFWHPSRRKLEKEFRLRIIDEAVNENVSLIMTGVIMRDNEAFYREVIQRVSENGGTCMIVHLTASKTELEKRMNHESRKVMKKISSKEKLDEWLQKYPESLDMLDFPKQLTIDTTDTTSEEILNKIMEAF